MFYLTLIFALMSLSLMAVSVSSENLEQKTHTIKSEELRDWYAQKRQMVVLDARTKPYFDGRVLPNAKWLPADAADHEILGMLPNKEITIVVYCGGTMCPASGWLYAKLQSLGYQKIYEYHEGISEWAQKGYPIQQV